MRETKIDQPNQDLVTDDDSEPWVPLSGQQGLSGAEDSVTDVSEPWSPLSGQQSVSGGAEVCSVHADCGYLIPRCPTSPLLFEDECSTESEPHFNDRPNCSQVSSNTSNCIPDDLDDSLGSIIGISISGPVTLGSSSVSESDAISDEGPGLGILPGTGETS
ncbi:hypothetical protein DPEC_G00259370 [Dallia pectoralis]|uniref:Uncharacterized protein n=1 Tax=Dallia pectoralis TaxID=75939 RepID=A0ACC2FRE1_DALPE|nr:hypothetical protein DPEC_G00259370 [Dallia pectoralis]